VTVPSTGAGPVRLAILLGGRERGGIRVAGLSLARRTALALSRAGVTRLVVAGEGVLAPGDAELARAGLTVEVVGGDTLAAARAAASGPALVATCAGVFEPSAALELAAPPVAAGEAVTLAHGGVAPGLALVAADVTELAAARARTFDPGATLVAAVTDAASARAARRLLFRSMRKPGDGFISRHFNRYLSLFVTGLIIDTPITPNQMTVVANLVGALGVWFTFQATWFGVGLGAVLVQAQSILDGCDGEIARLKYRSSRFGEWLDNVLDDQVNLLFGFGLAWASKTLVGGESWHIVAIITGVGWLSYEALLYGQLALRHRSGNPAKFRWWFQKDGALIEEVMHRPGLGTTIAETFRSLARRDVYLFVFMFLCLAHLPEVAAVWYAVLAVAYFAMTVIHLAKGGMPR
jgi:phosphatidylglycerophosphate synthase